MRIPFLAYSRGRLRATDCQNMWINPNVQVDHMNKFVQCRG